MRLSFHDAGTWSVAAGDGGPDGCLLMDDPANGGILEIADIVEDIYQVYQVRVDVRTDLGWASSRLCQPQAVPLVAAIRPVAVDIWLPGGVESLTCRGSLTHRRGPRVTQGVISRADFWALAANVAIEEALPASAFPARLGFAKHRWHFSGLDDHLPSTRVQEGARVSACAETQRYT